MILEFEHILNLGQNFINNNIPIGKINIKIDNTTKDILNTFKIYNIDTINTTINDIILVNLKELDKTTSYTLYECLLMVNPDIIPKIPHPVYIPNPEDCLIIYIDYNDIIIDDRHDLIILHQLITNKDDYITYPKYENDLIICRTNRYQYQRCYFNMIRYNPIDELFTINIVNNIFGITI